jgi:aminoglycoside/choline kinase family phosphotransferase
MPASLPAAEAYDPRSREPLKDQFLHDAGWAGANRHQIAGDASFRTYDRVELDGKIAILMNAPPPMEDIRPFVKIATILNDAGFSAPSLLAQDVEHGFLLLEDLGDDSFTRLLKREPAREGELYHEAGALLAALHQLPAQAFADVAPYDMAVIHREADLLLEWYLRATRGANVATEALASWRDAWARIIAALPALPPVLVLRDYHADNLMWLPTRQTHLRVGLLDFQDALVGSPAYDLVSVLEDARRDVAPETVEAVLSDYVARTGVDAATLRLHYAVLGAQRNAKIIGIFMRLTLRDGKPHYLDYLPRVWAHFRHDLAHPALAEIAAWVEQWLPAAYQTTPPLDVLTSTFYAQE